MISKKDKSSEPKPKRVITVDERERDFLIGMIFLVLALTTLPHLFGYAYPKNGSRYVGSAYNIDDYLVYLSWVQETARGEFFIRNLFTTDPQPAMLFNFLLSIMGLIMRVTHWSPQATVEFVRVTGAVGLLVLIYKFYRYCIPDNRAARLTAFGFVCFSSGFGWMNWRHWQMINPPGSPIDSWQPEAYTFTSIYVNALFVIASILIVGLLYSLLLAVRTGKMRYAVIAGVCGFIMGDIHSYDVLHVAAAWGLFLVIWTIFRWRRGVRRLWVHSILALAMTMPTTFYVYHAFRTNPVFNSRAESPTLTPPFYHYIPGYGLVFVFTVVAAVMLVLRRREEAKALAATKENGASMPSPDAAALEDKDAPEGIETVQAKKMGWADRASLLFIWCWAIAGFLVIYVPAKFQRKMLMGEHIPLCLLAGWGAAVLTRRLSKPARIVVLSLIVGASFVSNGFVIKRDMRHVTTNSSETQLQPVLDVNLVGALDFIKNETPVDAPVVSIPFYYTYIPGLTGHTVWCGHWSETPFYEDRVHQTFHAFDAATSDADREAFLKSTGCRYLLYVTKSFSIPDRQGHMRVYMDLASNPPPYLHNVYSNSEFTVFAIDK